MAIQLADRRHEAQLRELLAGSPMPGWVRLAFGREPDFFHAAGVQGKMNQVLIATGQQGRVTGMGCRAIRPAWVNGERMDIGYLSGLRLRQEAQRTGLLARGYAALRKLHQQNPVPVYLTTVIEGNAPARALLTSGRAGLPHYLDRGRYLTLAINLNRHRRRPVAPCEIRRGDEVGLDSFLGFLAEVGSRRQFFPVLEAGDFGGDYLRGLRAQDFRVALSGRGEILGMTAAWDQNAYKQTIVQGYARPVAALRPLVSGALRLGGFRPLPRCGQALSAIHIAFACVRGDDPQVMRALLERIYDDYQDSPHHFLLWGLHERDPLSEAARGFLSFRYVSRFYTVCWDDGLEFVKGLDPDKIPHLELATL